MFNILPRAALSGCMVSLCLGLSLQSHGQAALRQQPAPALANTVANPQTKSRATIKQPATFFTSTRTSATCNLVVNGDFDDQLTTPNGFIGNVAYPYQGGGELANWQATNESTPDYYATNAPRAANSNVGNGSTNPFTSGLGTFTPYNYDSSPGAHNGCLGLVNYFKDSNTYVEYATQQLTTALRGDRKYYASLQAYSAGGSFYASYVGLDITTDPRSTATNPLKLYNFSGCGIQSNTIIQDERWQPVSGIFQGVAGAQWLNVGNFRYSSSDWTQVRSGYGYLQAYVYVDHIEVYEIPVAGTSSTLACGGNVTIGEGCPIPGATYAWTVAGSSTPFATSLQVNVAPASTTTYTLTVTLPDRSTSSTSVTITASGAQSPNPYATQFDQQGDNCYNTAHFRFNDYHSSSTYTFTRGYNNPTIIRNVNTGVFIVKVSGTNTTATFTITETTACGQTATSEEIEAVYNCDEISTAGRPTRSTTAYPNPASESIVLPEGMEQATLINDKGVVLRETHQASKLDVQSLPNGLYNLRMMQNGKLVNQRIQVQH